MEIDWNKKVISLARQQKVTLTPDEIKAFSKELPHIAHAFDKLDAIDTENVAPSYHPHALELNLRNDEPKTPSAPVENHLRREKGYLKAPRILK